MPLNQNPWVIELLSWHGHERGGVRVPFKVDGGNPLRDAAGNPIVIATDLIGRLRALARQIALGEPAPRWVFLVGGPGNGKSEAVQDFLVSLDRELKADGALVDLLQQLFTPDPLVRWRVDVDTSMAASLPQSFVQRVGRLIIVQDASASDRPMDDAAAVLASFLDDLLDLLTSPPPLPLFVCCVNRGLLARALRSAQQSGASPELLELVRDLVRATALGSDALSGERLSCWPIEVAGGNLDGLVACWPLDVESLLLGVENGGIDPSPIDQVIETATQQDGWNVSDRCQTCDDSDLCPFFQNANSLEDPQRRGQLTSLLRRGELAVGRRWNFRDTFSLTAELLVGSWPDFDGVDHPCEWVHKSSALSRDETREIGSRAAALYALTSRLFVHALFPVSPTGRLAPGPRELASQKGFDTTLGVDSAIVPQLQSIPTHYVRTLLAEAISPRMDPALLSPQDNGHPLALLEDAYSQSVALGNAAWPGNSSPYPSEAMFLQIVQGGEDEWDLLSRDSAQVSGALRFLRNLASVLAKRSVGTRIGAHANEGYLRDYERSIRDESALDDLLDALQALLGDGGFRFNALESFGQPRSDADWQINLQGTSVPVEPISPAPRGGGTLPAHDLPAIHILGYSVPLTFDLYLALRLRRDGCAEGSLPASVRAAIDRIRHRFAGALCRDQDRFTSRSAEFLVKDRGRILVTRRNEPPKFRPIA
ncbi:MAG: hypothetical protein ACYDAG_03955 [Chloroflexota bacterium]